MKSILQQSGADGVPATTENREGAQTPRPDFPARLAHALGPILPGMIIDSLDVLTFGPVGLLTGVVVGSLAGYWLSRGYRLSPVKRLLGALAAGFYCMLPLTSFLPVGTLIGAYFRFHAHPEEPESASSE